MTTVIDLSDLGTRGFVIEGGHKGDLAGFSVSSAEDVNGDGYRDMIIGASRAGDAGVHTGKSYILYGHKGAFDTIDLDHISPADGFTITGETTAHKGGLFGASVSKIGDFDGDGFDDVVIGAPGVGGGAGATYVIYGKAPGAFVDLSLDHLSPADGFRISAGGNGQAGFSVSQAGDIDGDGYFDVITGAPDGDGGAGTAYIVFGRAERPAGIDLRDLSPADGVTLHGAAAGDQAGFCVSGASDFDDDGINDFMVGAPGNDDGGVDAGKVYVFLGRSDGFGTDGRIDLGDISPEDGFTIQGAAAGDMLGVGISKAGDVDADGYKDIIVAAPGADGGAGAVYLIFGKADGFAPIDLAHLDPAEGITIHGAAPGDALGFSISSTGDVNADGFNDIILGAKGVDGGGNGAGAAYVIYGKADGFADIDLADLSDADGFVIQGDAKGDAAGFAVSGTGDINGDGFSDMFVGAPYGDDLGKDAGDGYVVFGVAPTEAVTRYGTAIDNVIYGGLGDDSLFGRGGHDSLYGSEGDDLVSGQGGDDVLDGGIGDDDVIGGVGDDVLRGREGDDKLSGGRGADVLYGGEGQDRLTGGAGADAFHFSANGTAADAAHADLITDFHQSEHDLLDLSDYDADPATKGTDPFSFIGTSAFSGAAGQLRYQFSGGDTLVSGDLDGDKAADFTIRLSGNVSLTAGDFVFASAVTPIAHAHPFLVHPDLAGNHLIQFA